jgi:hypothetical protein
MKVDLVTAGKFCRTKNKANSAEQLCGPNAVKKPPEAWYGMYMKLWWLELAMVRMSVLSQVHF